MSTYYERNKDKVLAYHRKRRAEMPPQKKDYVAEQKRATMLRLRYKLTPEQVAVMKEAQQGCCAICGVGLDTTITNIDHCHTTGKVRGLLCVNCNRGLGAFGDNVRNMEKALEYLKACQ
jgi:hypothetical protein